MDCDMCITFFLTCFMLFYHKYLYRVSWQDSLCPLSEYLMKKLSTNVVSARSELLKLIVLLQKFFLRLNEKKLVIFFIFFRGLRKNMLSHVATWYLEFEIKTEENFCLSASTLLGFLVAQSHHINWDIRASLLCKLSSFE